MTDNETPVVTVEMPSAPGTTARIDKEALRQLPPRQAEAIIQLVQSESFRGPIPPPEILAKYNAALPGSMDRIITMAERQAKHNQSMDRLAIWLTFAERFIGQLFGLTIGLAAIGGGVYVMLQGTGAWSYIAGTILGGSGLASLVGVFVYGRKVAQQTEDDE